MVIAPGPTETQALVDASGLGKSYPKVFRNTDRLRAMGGLLLGRGNRDGVSVLRDVDMVVNRGQSVGIIGENGAGKSTLLKLISGVLTPTSGQVRVAGRVGALLELGAGFHPEFSGRDNVMMAATLYGLTAAELRDRLPGIIEFADIGDYIDEPVKHYSSGMIVRLGFAVIAALRPDLLITDEVLAVGDESFQKKCVQWLERYLGDGGTLLLVSHSMYHVQKLCQRACWLRDGTVAMQGDVFDVTQAYLAYHERKAARTEAPTENRATIEFTVDQFEINGQTGSQPVLIEFGSTLEIRVCIHSRDCRVPVLLIGILRGDGTAIYGFSSETDEVAIASEGSSGDYRFAIELADLQLLPGSYTLRAHAADSEGLRLFDTAIRDVTIRGSTREMGMIRLPHRWIEHHQIEVGESESTPDPHKMAAS
ncbi:MAG: ABC transporter ATP-binding protein [Dokdonella sp.]